MGELNKDFNRQLYFYFLIGFALFIIAMSLAIWYVRKTFKPLLNFKDKIFQIERGELENSFDETYPNEVGILYKSMSSIIESLREVTEVSKEIAKGEYGKKVTIKSDQDVLSIAINKMSIVFLQSSYE